MAYSAMGFAGRGAQQQGQGQGQQRSGFGGGGDGGAKRVMHPIRSVTIKQLLTANRVGDGVTVIDGREATQVTVCGRIIEWENGAASAATSLTAKHQGYRISDGTGMLVVRQWAEQGVVQETIPIGQIVRCSGSVKVWMDKPTVTGTVRVVVDCNEFTYHLLECMLTHLRITQGNKGSSNKRSASAVAAVSNNPNTVGQMNVVPGGEGKILCTEAVLRSIRNSGRKDLGLSVDEIANAVTRYGFTISDVRSAIRSLSNEGKVFLCGDNRYAM